MRALTRRGKRGFAETAPESRGMLSVSSYVSFTSPSPLAVSKSMLGVNKSDAHFQAALVLAERTFDKAWGQEEAKAAALAERQALELELQVVER